MICDTSRHPIAIGSRAAYASSLHLSPITGQLRIDRTSLTGRVVAIEGENIVCERNDGVRFSGRDGDLLRICNLRTPAAGDRSTLGHLEVVA